MKEKYVMANMFVIIIWLSFLIPMIVDKEKKSKPSETAEERLSRRGILVDTIDAPSDNMDGCTVKKTLSIKAKDAMKIAKIAWRHLQVENADSFILYDLVLVKDSIWEVHGIYKNGVFGLGGRGVYTEISKKDCKVLRTIFTK